MSASIQPRPGAVTTVVVLTWIAAILDMAGGLVLIVFAGDQEVQAAAGASSSTLTTMGWTVLVIGVVVALVATRLAAGGSLVRMLVTVLMLLRLGSGVWLLLAGGSHAATEAITTIAISGVVLYLLWTGPASEYFATHG